MSVSPGLADGAEILPMIYLDYNATTPVAQPVAEAMIPFLSGNFGNAASAHAAGAAAAAAVEEARANVAELVGAASANEIAFTSGGTESDNWAVIGTAEAMPERRHVITTRVEHGAVAKAFLRLAGRGWRVTFLGVDNEGRLDLDELSDALTEDTALVSIMAANNETGVLFPIAEAAALVKERSSAIFHSDGVNAVGKIPIDLSKSEIDLFSISAHKFGGPKGVGALYIRDGVRIQPMLIGGGQESGRRSGTTAVHQVVGMGAAARLAKELEPMEAVRELRDQLESSVAISIENTRVNGGGAERTPNTANISFENTNGEMILHRLNEAGICASTGSACHSKVHDASSTLTAMEVPFSYAMGSIRFSLGRPTTADEIREVTTRLPAIISELRAMSASA